LVLAAAVGAGCSLLVQFDPEAQPCDSAGACSVGFTCVPDPGGDGGVCKSTDGGTVIVDDGGMPDGSTCAARETQCGDGRDNDCDNTTDCADSDCGGVSCNDRDPCTTGEVCSGGTCPRGTPVVCNTPPSACLQASGTCEADAGRCVYNALPDGTTCGAGQASRCCQGTCINTTLNGTHCGGCNLSCSAQQVCQPIDSSGCMPSEPSNTSGRCTCTGAALCPNGQVCTNGVCFPALPQQCAPSQGLQQETTPDGGTCGYYCRY
jgi:hypothetical protein